MVSSAAVVIDVDVGVEVVVVFCFLGGSGLPHLSSPADQGNSKTGGGGVDTGGGFSHPPTEEKLIPV